MIGGDPALGQQFRRGLPVVAALTLIEDSRTARGTATGAV
jgi:hypothetical protein